MTTTATVAVAVAVAAAAPAAVVVVELMLQHRHHHHNHHHRGVADSQTSPRKKRTFHYRTVESGGLLVRSNKCIVCDIYAISNMCTKDSLQVWNQ